MKVQFYVASKRKQGDQPEMTAEEKAKLSREAQAKKTEEKNALTAQVQRPYMIEQARL